jgi:hypothetical protein
MVEQVYNMLKTLRDNPVFTKIESVIAPMATLCPGNPKIMRKQDKQNERASSTYLFIYSPEVICIGGLL